MTMSSQARQLSRPVRRLDDEPELFTPPPKLPVKPAVRKLEKAPHAFRTISEVGEELNVPQHVLRFWETRFTQLRPLKRGGGRRYYRSEDVMLLRQIHSLLYSQGYTIKGAQKVLKEKPSGEREIMPVARPAKPVVVDNSPLETAPASPAKLSDDSRAQLQDMLAELKALRALV